MGTFSVERLIRFGHCDPAGIAYFPAYFTLLDGVVEDFCAALGFSWPELLRQRDVSTPTAHIACDFARPSRHGDRLLFSVRIVRLGRTSLELAHHVTRDGETIWSAKQVLVLMNMSTGGSHPWPDDVRAALQAFMDRPDEETGGA